MEAVGPTGKVCLVTSWCDSESEGNNLVSYMCGFGSDAFLRPNSLHNPTPSFIITNDYFYSRVKKLGGQHLCTQRCRK